MLKRLISTLLVTTLVLVGVAHAKEKEGILVYSKNYDVTELRARFEKNGWIDKDGYIAPGVVGFDAHNKAGPLGHLMLVPPPHRCSLVQIRDKVGQCNGVPLEKSYEYHVYRYNGFDYRQKIHWADFVLRLRSTGWFYPQLDGTLTMKLKVLEKTLASLQDGMSSQEYSDLLDNIAELKADDEANKELIAELNDGLDAINRGEFGKEAIAAIRVVVKSEQVKLAKQVESNTVQILANKERISQSEDLAGAALSKAVEADKKSEQALQGVESNNALGKKALQEARSAVVTAKEGKNLAVKADSAWRWAIISLTAVIALVVGLFAKWLWWPKKPQEPQTDQKTAEALDVERKRITSLKGELTKLKNKVNDPDRGLEAANRQVSEAVRDSSGCQFDERLVSQEALSNLDVGEAIILTVERKDDSPICLRVERSGECEVTVYGALRQVGTNSPLVIRSLNGVAIAIYRAHNKGRLVGYQDASVSTLPGKGS